MAIFQTLRELQLGNLLCEADQISLADAGDLVRFDTGDVVFREGDKHTYIYWIIEGDVSLEMTAGTQSLRPLLTLGRGDALAWSALLARGRMTATAKVVRDSCLLRYDSQRLLDLCALNHEIGYRVMEHLARQLAQRLLATRLQLLDLFGHPREDIR
ncbi:cyclic nucleotide-binding domain-containing protein [Aporhodopirellula aestuarii]|uniref:Crp/Fnr family transcriptional regulator n=1 Tax=Aporhodopirellula aestuarii TaxID=2950107 RepID=A0ABT0TZQ4_9BACT|nr:cyclic nucleotide-binding domain-containing protein [Aporhodopirellula aestuarii]MCM2369713.1 Crp/Fnr family transcriptional regulator [Aporhodopirellula aestuarii]